MKAYRHGEIMLVAINKLPDVEPTKTKTIMQGSHGNNHDIDNGVIYFKKDGTYVFGYLEANNTTLFHKEHGIEGKAKIEDGYYELRKQQEYTPEGLIPVID